MPLDAPEKAEHLLDLADGFDSGTFVETGTGFAALTEVIAPHWERVVTVESVDAHYRAAALTLLDHPNVQAIHGDSARLLDGILGRLDRPCVLFLDAHETTDSPRSALAKEMVHVGCSTRKHLVLIDDARWLADRWGWMSVDALERWGLNYGYRFDGVYDDIAVLRPC